MIEKTIIVRNKSGLHARPAYSFSNAAKKFSSNITLFMNEETANAKSIISIIGLGVDCGAELKIRISGHDEAIAMNKLISLLENLAEEV